MAEEKEKIKDSSNGEEEKVMDKVEAQKNASSDESLDSTQGKKESPDQENSGESLSKEDQLMADNQELKEKHLRLYSEFENYRRRTAKERLELISTASEELIKDLLPILDDFERAFKASNEDKTEGNPDEGVRLIYNKMVKILGSKGLKPMEGLIGKPFDAETQEAITQIPAPNDELKGKIVDVVEKGYLLGEKVIRYAKVVIGK